MSDLIERQAAIDALAKHEKSKGHNYTMFVDVVSECAEIIRDLPSAQPEQRWIPSGEKPPEKGSYLVWMPFAPSKHRMTVAEYCGGYWNIKTPISAWMPLPEPYREETE